MRMWHKKLITHLCSKHLNAMHGELHKFHSDFLKKRKITGRVSPVAQIEPYRMKAAHDECARLLKNHNSPYEMPDISYLPAHERSVRVSLVENIYELMRRCPGCRKNIRSIAFRNEAAACAVLRVDITEEALI